MQPDFIIIGAMKSGTSTLAAQIGAQSGMFMTTPKEPNFFSDDAIWANGMTWYEDLFANANPDDIKGEASTHYTKSPRLPHTIERMTASLKTTPKIVYVLRNPIERAISHFMHAWSEGETERDINDALRRNPDYIDFGCYGMQIAPFIQAFGAESVLLTSLEVLKDAPEAELSRVTDFLGFEGTPVWQTDHDRQNESAARIRKFRGYGLIIDNPVARALRRSLVPKSIRSKIRDRQTFGDRPVISDEMRQHLTARFLEDRATLAAQFPDHPALSACYPFAPT